MDQRKIIMAPMFLVSNPQTVIAATQAGIIGSFPLLNARPVETCAAWLEEINQTVGDAVWAVNLISHPLANKRYEDDLELIRKYQPPIVITSLGSPKQVVDMVHGYGGKVFSDVISVRHAKKAAKLGVDGLILVCAGAGGHGGTLNPFAFVSAVKGFYTGEIILSGAVSTGSDILSAEVMGADYVYMGTRFLAANETDAPEDFKRMLVDSTIEDIIYTDSFSGIHANFLIPSLIKEGIDPNNLPKHKGVDLSHLVDAKAWRDIWSAGQGVTNVTALNSIGDIVMELKKEYENAMGKLE